MCSTDGYPHDNFYNSIVLHHTTLLYEQTLATFAMSLSERDLASGQIFLCLNIASKFPSVRPALNIAVSETSVD